MKFVIALVFFVIGCNLIAADNAYDFLWKANSEPDMKSYKVWVWEGADTSNVSFADYTFHGEFSHDSLLAVYPDSNLKLIDTYISAENGQWLRFAASAVDSSGNESERAYSDYYQKVDTTPPGKMSGLSIQH